jgi:hypothetical protein
VKSTTSANRIDAELNWSAIVRVSALSLSAIDRGRMLSSRPSALACSSRSAPRVPALAGEHGQQREHDRAAHCHVEAEHRAREPFGDRRRHATDQLSDDARAEEHDEVRDVPASRGSDVAEHECPEGGENPPQTDPAGVEEAPQRDHRERGSEQDGDLADTQEVAELPCTREDDDRRQEDREVRERYPSHRRAEREIEGRPEQRDRQDQHRDQHEKRLAGARVVVVLRIRADPRQTPQHPIADAPDRAHPAHTPEAHLAQRSPRNLGSTTS